MPRLKPPFFPAANGLYVQPTIVNNVETLSNLPWLMRQRRRRPTPRSARETSPGTRMFAVSGHVKRPGVFEIVNGTTTFRDLIYGDEFCQGIRDGHELKAFVPGGGSAPWFFAEQLDLPFEGRLVGAAGSMLGSGAIMVMDETTDIADGRADARAASTPTSRAASARRAARAARGWSGSSQRIVDGHGTPEPTSTCCSTSARPSARARSRTRRASGSGIEAVPFPYKMTTICFVGPSAVRPDRTRRSRCSATSSRPRSRRAAAITIPRRRQPRQ